MLGFFALLTRFEPSVLRASAMAAVACTAVGLGRPTSRLRVLALAVAAIVLVDPLLVGSVGFQLSVGASAAIIVVAGPLAERLPGPRWLAEALAVTLAAQVGVAPVAVPVFGGLPLVSVPANLLAVPAAGPLMAWGLLAGPAAGLLGPPFDGLLHLPSRLLLDWVAGVASVAASLPLGRVQAGHLLVAAAAVAVVVACRDRLPLVRGGSVVLAAAALSLPAILPSAGPLSGVEPTGGALLWRDGGVVLVVDDPEPGRLLDGLRRTGVERIDVVVATRGNRSSADVVHVLRERLEVRLVVAPSGHGIRDAEVGPSGTAMVVGGLTVVLEQQGPVLAATVSPAILDSS